MESIKLLHAADLHLRDRDIDEAEKCLGFLVETAETEAVDLVVIAGDIFHSQDIKMDSRSAVLAIKTVSALADIAPVAIILGTSTHDGHAPEILRFARGACPIRVASGPEQIYLQGETFYNQGDPELSSAPEAILSLVPQPTKQFFQTTAGIEGSDQEIGQAMSGLFAGFGASAAEYHPCVPHILVYHGCVSGGKASNNQLMTGRDIEISRDQLAMSGAGLILCGHLHLPQELPGNIFYSGSIYPVDIGENHKHGFWIHKLSADLSSLFLETPCKRIVRLKFDLTAGESITVPFEGIVGATVRIDVTVFQDEIGQVSRETIIENLKRWGAESIDIKVSPVPRETIRAAAVLEAQTLKDEFLEMSRLRGEQIDPEILVMAEKLETLPGEELLKEVAA
ncbi:MAG: hypothetical protein WCK00_08855 [Deltaproteobacteria bacterium]